MKYIKLGNSVLKFIVDAEDFDRVNLHSWSFNFECQNINTNINGQTIQIGRFILDYAGELEVDHRDRNRLNNRKLNLRLATKNQNTANQPKRINNTSGYKGVVYIKDRRNQKWRSQITVKRQTICLGHFNTKENAAICYNQSAIKHFGEFAYQNVI